MLTAMLRSAPFPVESRSLTCQNVGMKTEPLLLLFTREGCHLCERVEETLNELGLAWRAVDIESDPGLEARYGLVIPVVRCEHTKKELCYPFGKTQLLDLLGAA